MFMVQLSTDCLATPSQWAVAAETAGTLVTCYQRGVKGKFQGNFSHRSGNMLELSQ